MSEDTTTVGVLNSDKGISNNTIAALVILALLITIIGTLAVISNMNAETPTHKGTSVGVMSLTIISPSDSNIPNNGSTANNLKNN